MGEVIRFPGEIIKVQQLTADNAIRVTIDMPEHCIPQMAMLAEVKRLGIPLEFEARANNGSAQA